MTHHVQLQGSKDDLLLLPGFDYTGAFGLGIHASHSAFRVGICTFYGNDLLLPVVALKASIDQNREELE